VADRENKFQSMVESIENAIISGDSELAKSLLASLETIPDDKKRSYEKEFLEIRCLWNINEYEPALKKLRKLLKNNALKPGTDAWTGALMLKSHINYAMGHAAAAENNLKKLTTQLDSHSPYLPDIHFNLASIIRDRGAIDEALNIYNDVIACPESSFELITRTALAMAHMHSDLNLDGVREYTRIVTEKTPKWGDWKSLKIAEILNSLADFREGLCGAAIRELYKHMREADDSNFTGARIRARLALTEILVTLGDYASGKNLLDEIGDILKNVQVSDLRHLQNQAELLWYKAEIRQEGHSNRLWEALDRLEILLAVIAKYPRPPGPIPFWLLLGEIQTKLGLINLAVRSFQRAQTEAESIGSTIWNAAARYASASLKWRFSEESEKHRGIVRNRILSETTQALDILSASNRPELEWRIHFFRGEIFEDSGEQYPSREEMKIAAQIARNLLLSFDNPALQAIYRQSEIRHDALLHLQSAYQHLLEPDEQAVRSEPGKKNDRKSTTESLDLSQSQKLQNILNAMFELHSAGSIPDLFDALLRHSLQTLDGDRAVVMVFKQGKNFEKHNVKFRSGSAHEESYTIPGKWLAEASSGTRILSFSWDVSDSNHQARFLIVAPLCEKKVVKALLCIDRSQGKGVFSDDDQAILSTLTSVASIAYSSLEIQERLTKLSDQLRREIIPEFPNIIGQSEPMKNVFIQMQKIAMSDIPVVIVGETGTGKDLIARTIHSISNRAQAPFVHLDCSAIPSTLLESELFGIEDGVATGVESRIGIIEYANDGTILLDEVGDIPLNTQAKLLRVLQEQEFVPIGSNRSVSVSIRIIATSTRKLETLIEEEKLREDFYYRISGLTIELPPLRNRLGDIILLARTFLQRYCREFKKNINGFETDLFDVMLAYDWPGNVRELEHMVRKASLFCRGDRITLQDMDLPEVRSKRMTLHEAVFQMERNTAREALKQCNNSFRKAAETLDISIEKLKSLLSVS
jgi:transcriptional regulator with GAF, ATPase, and Fis domain/tetratricopeptide (TPR) repeat protein